MDPKVLGTALTVSEYKATCLKVAKYHDTMYVWWYWGTWVQAIVAVGALVTGSPSGVVFAASLAYAFDRVAAMHKDQGAMWRVIERLV